MIVPRLVRGTPWIFRKNNGPLLQKVLEFMARDEQENAAKFPGNGQVVDLASPIRPGPNGLTRKSLI